MKVIKNHSFYKNYLLIPKSLFIKTKCSYGRVNGICSAQWNCEEQRILSFLWPTCWLFWDPRRKTECYDKGNGITWYDHNLQAVQGTSDGLFFAFQLLAVSTQLLHKIARFQYSLVKGTLPSLKAVDVGRITKVTVRKMVINS